MSQTIRNIISLRKKNKLSQEDIADGYGVHQVTISQLESGKRELEANLLIYIADRLNMKIDDVVHYHIKKDQLKEDSPPYETKKPHNEIQTLRNQLEDYKFLVQASQNLVASLEKEVTDLKKKLDTKNEIVP